MVPRGPSLLRNAPLTLSGTARARFPRHSTAWLSTSRRQGRDHGLSKNLHTPLLPDSKNPLGVVWGHSCPGISPEPASPRFPCSIDLRPLDETLANGRSAKDMCAPSSGPQERHGPSSPCPFPSQLARERCTEVLPLNSEMEVSRVPESPPIPECLSGP